MRSIFALKMMIFHLLVAHKQQQSTYLLLQLSSTPFTQQQQLILIMKIYSNTLKQLISTRKFYEIVSERKDRNLPKTAEEFIISKFLKSSPTQTSERKQSLEINEELALKKSKQVNYQQFMREHPNGSIITESYKNVELSLVSLNYMNINLPSIYQICEKAQPDLIFVQARPQAYIQDYELLPKTNSVFSDKKYIEQICLNPYQVKQQILDQEIVNKLQHILGKGGKEVGDKVFIRDHKDIVDDEIVMISSYLASINGKTLMLGELPQQPWREWLCNSHTLMELTEIFKHITKNIPFYQSLKLSPYKLGALLKPELFLNIRDRYMATLLEMAIATKKYKKILCITGLLQNQAIQQILLNESLFKHQGQNSEFTPVIEYLIGPQIKHSILRSIQGWQIIEKHIILDVLHYGEEVLNEPIQTFTTTNKVIAFYGRKVNDYPQAQLMRFRYDKTIAYLNIMRDQILQGKQLKRKFLLREAIRSADL